MKRTLTLFLLLFCTCCLADIPPIQLLKTPQNFSISLYAYPVPDARQMALAPNDIVFVGSRKEGKVYALIPDKDKKSARTITIASDLTLPNGVVFHEGDLYVIALDRILIFKDILHHLDHPPAPIVKENVLPNETHHGWRYARLGPDKKLYVGVGAPCNNCLKDDKRFASILRMNLDGTHQEVYAHGVRNTVGFDWNPITHKLWFTDNGRDWMGDNIPPDELNEATKPGMHFGFPYCHGKNISDPTYGKQYPCSAFTPPVLELSPHVASLGMIFYKGSAFPKAYQNQIFIAQHGSWNRTTKIGYDVLSVKFNSNHSLTPEVFISGWLQQGKPWGRPVDILEMKDGSLLISDDYAGAVYRVSYAKL